MTALLQYNGYTKCNKAFRFEENTMKMKFELNLRYLMSQVNVSLIEYSLNQEFCQIDSKLCSVWITNVEVGLGNEQGLHFEGHVAYAYLNDDIEGWMYAYCDFTYDGTKVSIKENFNSYEGFDTKDQIEKFLAGIAVKV